MKKFKTAYRMIAALLIACTLLPMTGCQYAREIESLSVVAGAALDKGEDGKRYKLTVEVLDTNSDIQGNEIRTVYIQSQGDTIFEAVRNAVPKTAKRLYWSHCEILILGEELAKEGIEPVMDWFLRDLEPRSTMKLLVSQEASASEVLMSPPISEGITSFTINDSLRSDLISASMAPDIALYRAYTMLETSQAQSLCLPAVGLDDSIEEPIPILGGTAIFNGDALAGYLSPELSKVYTLLTNQSLGSILATHLPQVPQGNISFEVYDTHCSLNPSFEGDTLHMGIEVNLNLSLGEIDHRSAEVLGEDVQRLRDIAQQEVEQSIDELLTLSQKHYRNDILGFGRALEIAYPDYWKAHAAAWREEFAALPYELTVTVNLRNAGLFQI